MPAKVTIAERRHRHDAARRLHDTISAGEGARPQAAALVRHLGLDHQRAVLLLIDRGRRATRPHMPWDRPRR